ncbi:MAG TPA: hypothetical protein VI757_03180 [Bacteroidia bacterium]|nr:hypothetical protein [Bacteroidia bacterium]
MTSYNYRTVSEAVNELQKRGYSIDFNAEENISALEHGKYTPEDFEITEVYRYEGDSDPADEAVVYALESKAGVKGIMVNGYGISSSTRVGKALSRIQIRG